jgi:DNA-binding response OmpR family regulator
LWSAPWGACASSEDSELAQLRAFEAGCDDYLAKPLSYPLLLGRIRALVRRSRGGFVPRLRVGALEIDALARRAGVAGNPLPLSKLEFDLLLHLAGAPTRLFGKQELHRDLVPAIWLPDPSVREERELARFRMRLVKHSRRSRTGSTRR